MNIVLTFLFYFLFARIFNYFKPIEFRCLGMVLDQNVKKIKLINRRMFLASAAKAVFFFGIIRRLFYLQVEQNKKYLTLSDKIE